MSKGEQTRQRIVEEAAALLNQRGFEGFAYSDLMRATGLEKGGIYRHFASKEALAAEAFQFAWQSAVESRTRNLNGITNSVDQLKQLVSNFVQVRPAVPGGCPLLNAAVDSDDGNAMLRTQAERALRDWLATLVRVIRGGQRRGEIKADLSAGKIARVLIATLEGAMMVGRLERKRTALLDVESHLHKLLERDVRS